MVTLFQSRLSVLPCARALPGKTRSLKDVIANVGAELVVDVVEVDVVDVVEVDMIDPTTAVSTVLSFENALLPPDR